MEFHRIFDARVYFNGSPHLLEFCIVVCKKLCPDYVVYIEKYDWGNLDVMLDAIEVIEQAQYKTIDKITLEHHIELVEAFSPDEEKCSVLIDYCAVHACDAIRDTLSFLLSNQSLHTFFVGCWWIQNISMKLEDNYQLTKEEIDEHPSVVEAKNYLLAKAL